MKPNKKKGESLEDTQRRADTVDRSVEVEVDINKYTKLGSEKDTLNEHCEIFLFA